MLSLILILAAQHHNLHAIKHTKTAEKKGQWSASYEYPAFESKSPVALLSNKTLARAEKAELDAYAKECEDTFSSSPAPDSAYVSEETTAVSLAWPNLISVSASDYEDAGGAHPNTTFTFHSFGLAEGHAKQLKLQDLFRREVSGAKTVTPLILADLRRKHASNLDDPEFKLDAGLLEQFVLGRRSITFMFAPYQVASYAEGAFLVEIPYSRIRSKLDPAGPLKPLLNP